MSNMQERRSISGAASNKIPELFHSHSTPDHAPLLAIAVQRELRNGNVRRMIYRSIPAAEKCVQRATQEGRRASLQLVELTPISQPTPAQLAALEVGDERG